MITIIKGSTFSTVVLVLVHQCFGHANSQCLSMPISWQDDKLVRILDDHIVVSFLTKSQYQTVVKTLTQLTTPGH